MLQGIKSNRWGWTIFWIGGIPRQMIPNSRVGEAFAKLSGDVMFSIDPGLPSDIALHLLNGVSMRESGCPFALRHPSLAVHLAEMSAWTDPDEPSFLLVLALAYERAGRLNDAIRTQELGLRKVEGTTYDLNWRTAMRTNLARYRREAVRFASAVKVSRAGPKIIGPSG